MWLIHMAMRRPITVLMAIFGVALCSILAINRMKVDIFPDLGEPVIYVAQPYGGMDPAQMEGYLVNYYEYHFLYIRGIDYVESRSVQGAALMKLRFHEGTDMATAMSETVAQVNRSRSFMPPGTVPPFVMRFDAGSVPVGYLVFSSETRTVDEISDLALFRVRPMFARLPGVSAPPPFGGTARSLVVRVDPERLRAQQLSPDDVVQAIARTNTISPSGNVRIGDVNYISPLNASVKQAVELNDVPLRQGVGPTVYLRDVGYAEDAADILTSYALVNGQRAVYIAATKRADASTLDTVRRIQAALPTFRAAVPEDIQVSFEFDQSFYVTTALRSLVREGLLGALLTGLMILIALRSLRSAFIVVMTIPIALLSAVVALWATGQSLNLMTLGGLTLAIGILVDESVIAIENIHTHLGGNKTVGRAVLEASREVVAPRLLAMLCVVAVFAPSFFMDGVARAMFVPLALAVAFSMIASYFLASTMVPILETWLHRKGAFPAQVREDKFLKRMQTAFGGLTQGLLRIRYLVAPVYVLGALAAVALIGGSLGTEIFPRVDNGLVQMRVRAPAGTRVEKTELVVRDILNACDQIAGKGNVETSIAFVGVQPSSFPVNLIFLWTGGPHEAVIRMKFREGAGVRSDAFQEALREQVAQVAPGTSISFEAADLVSQVMSFGAPTAIEVAVSGPSLPESRGYAEQIASTIAEVPGVRDAQLGELLEYPTVQVNVDRVRAAQLGVTVDAVGKALAPVTWSSRFTTPVYWADPKSGIAYQVQVELPQAQIDSLQAVEQIPVKGSSHHGVTLLGDVAKVNHGETIGEYHRFNMQRMLTVTANVTGADLGSTAKRIQDALTKLPEAPRGVVVAIRGQVAPMNLLADSLQFGLLLAIIAVFLLLAAYFQSLRVAFVVLMAVPAVLAGVAIALAVTGTTLNVQSFMGAIMAIGVSVADSILLCTFADRYRREGIPVTEAAAQGAVTRMRPILMTTIVMVAGMIPLATGNAQTAPLGIAVIGGLAASTLAALLMIPSVYAIALAGASRSATTIDPDDPESAYYDGAVIGS
ncbi:MAG: efflux RND transporter permease subunit [Bryobacterales bacterium]|jgi:multidrug efflux pump subunit AcrB|nr:efflux RND transporter permease subunit [Bryobacterales bacterium]